jgi:glycosyltransferase involved in cell wall biosynthesis
MALMRLTALLRRLRPDLVSTHSSKAGWLGRMAARLTGFPVVFTAHGWAFADGVPAGPRLFYTLAERLAAPLADHIIAVSEYDRRLALERRIAGEDRITRIYNGIADPDVERASPRFGPPRIIMTGRFAEQKDHAGLVRALARLRCLDWTLHLAGDGATQSDVASLAASLGLQDRVNFLGQRNDIPSLLRKADVYALISHWEGFPYGILEAMCAGLPVVASDVGGVAEAVSHGDTGFVVPHADEQAIADALGRLLTSPELRARMGAAGRARYLSEFSIDMMIEHTFAVYQRVAAAGHGRSAATQ